MAFLTEIISLAVEYVLSQVDVFRHPHFFLNKWTINGHGQN